MQKRRPCPIHSGTSKGYKNIGISTIEYVGKNLVPLYHFIIFSTLFSSFLCKSNINIYSCNKNNKTTQEQATYKI